MNDYELKTREPTVPVPKDFDHCLDLSDITLPAIILWQPLTNIEGLEGEQGDLVNSVTAQNYGNELTAFVVDVWKTAREYGGRDEREIVRFSSDGKHWDDDGSVISADSLRFKNGEPPEVSVLYHYLVIIDGEMLPAVVTFKGASIRNGKKLNTLLSVTKPYWCNAFKFRSVNTQNDKGRYAVLQAFRSTKRPSSTIARMCQEFYHINRKSRIRSYETDTVLEEQDTIAEEPLPF